MICVLGINHKTASQDIREKFSISNQEISVFAEIIQHKTEVNELVILSTCNRTELYCYSKGSVCATSFDTIMVLFHNFKGVKEDYSEYFYNYSGLDAVVHLFRVTSGIDSMVIGEDQIVRQVKEAYLYCTKLALTDAVLMRLFQKSFETGKKVRTKTEIQQGATSVSYVAADLCQRKHKDLSNKSVLFIGAGETGELTLKNMIKRGVGDICIANRTTENAVKLISDYNGKMILFDNFTKELGNFDIVIAATGATDHLITVSHVKKAKETLKKSGQIYIDLSVPRNIEKEVGSIEGVTLWSMDDLQAGVSETAQKRYESIDQANEIINEMVQEFQDWLDSRNLRPVIKAIQNNFHKVKSEELLIHKENQRSQNPPDIDEYADKLTDKLARNIIKNLKLLSKEESEPLLINKIHHLFDVE